MSQNHKSLVLEERSNEMRQLEVEAFIQNLNLRLGTSKRFLEWTKQNDIPFSIITTVEMNEQYWKWRIRFHRFNYNHVGLKAKLLISTEGIQI